MKPKTKGLTLKFQEKNKVLVHVVEPEKRVKSSQAENRKSKMVTTSTPKEVKQKRQIRVNYNPKGPDERKRLIFLLGWL